MFNGRSNKRIRQRGVTLVELLVVMGIIALMMGLGASAYVGMARRRSQEGAAEQVLGMLRRARVSAIDGGRGAVVRINPENRSLYGISDRVIAAWHFEGYDGGQTPGAQDMNGTIEFGTEPAGEDPGEAQILVRGKLGLAFQLNYDDGNRAWDENIGQYVNCERYPVYDQTGGIRLEAYVQASGTTVSTPQPVIWKWDGQPDSSGYALWVEWVPAEDRYQVHARFRPQGGPTINLRTAPGRGPAVGQTAHLAAEYDGYEARLFVDGVLADLDSYRADDQNDNPAGDPNTATEEDFDPGDVLVPARAENLYIGGDGDDDFFMGRIDEPRLLSVAGGEPVVLPNRVLLWSTDEAVYFDGQGSLDLARHSQPVYVAVGDPYRTGELDLNNPLPAGATELPLTQIGPNWASEGYILVEYTDGGDTYYELLHYDDIDMSVNELQGIDDYENEGGNAGTGETHEDGERVYFARVVRISPMGLIERVD
mgnify:FL=1